MSIDELGKAASRCIQSYRDGDLNTLNMSLAALEDIHPTVEPEWAVLNKLFTAVNRPAWVEIMAARFLESAPDNVEALFVELGSLCRQKVPIQDASKEELALIHRKLSRLEKLGEPSVERFIRLGSYEVLCKTGEDAVCYLRKALRLQPENVEARRIIIRTFIKTRYFKKAQDEIRDLCKNGRQDPDTKILAIRLSLQLNDIKLARDILTRSIPFNVKLSVGQRIAIVIIGASIGLISTVSRYLEDLDFAEISDIDVLSTLYEALIGWRCGDHQKRIVDRILTISPGNEHFRTVKQSLDRGVNRAFLFG